MCIRDRAGPERPARAGVRRLARGLGTLLCLSSRAGFDVGGFEGAVDLPGEVALETAADLLGCAAFGASSLDVGAGVGVVGHARDRRDVQGAVQAPVAAAVESVSNGVPG